MKSFMECETILVISHLIKEVLDFKTFLHGYVGIGARDFLEGHSRSQYLKLYMDSSRCPLMKNKNLCIDNNWLLEHSKGIRLWSEIEDGQSKVPSGSPPRLALHLMKSLEKVRRV